jgi:hypothetical protein
MMNVGFPTISLWKNYTKTIKASLGDVYLTEISALEYALYSIKFQKLHLRNQSWARYKIPQIRAPDRMSPPDEEYPGLQPLGNFPESHLRLMDFIKNWTEEWPQKNTIETRSRDVCQNTEQGDSHHSAVPVKIGNSCSWIISGD